MRVLLAITLLALLTGAFFLIKNKEAKPVLQMGSIPNNVVFAYNQWKMEHNVVYEPEVDAQKLEVFYENLQFID